MRVTTHKGTRFRNNGNQISGFNLYNETVADFYWSHMESPTDNYLMRKPRPVLIMDYIWAKQYNTSAAVESHFYKLYMDHVDYLEKIYAKSDAYNLEIAIGYADTIGISTDYLVPNKRDLPDNVTYTEVDTAAGTVSEQQLFDWYTTVLDGMDAKPEMIALVVNGFVGAGAGYTAFYRALESDKRYILFDAATIPYTYPNTQYWIQDVGRVLEVLHGIPSKLLDKICE